MAKLFPLYKKNDKLEPGNYRLLVAISALPEIFERMLDARMCEWLNRVGALSDLQGGFRCAHERATVDQIFLLKELGASHRECGVDTYLCFVDVAKAHDTVSRPLLWYN